MGPGPGQREESQQETTITLRQPEIRLRFDILLSLSALLSVHNITLHFTITAREQELILV